MAHNRGYARYSVGSSVVKLTDAPANGVTLPTSAQSAIIQDNDAANDIMWRDDGVDPTATEGMQLTHGTGIEYKGDLTKVKMISKQGAAINVTISYYSET
jgi:hypothetical protein